MDNSEPIVPQKQLAFCEVDNALADAFLRDAANAVKNAGAGNHRELQASVVKSMLIFHRHSSDCEDCRKA
jgi:hypothetical protein